MKTLNVIVTNKIATYQTRCGDIVCGNSDYQINFTFDSEWDEFPQKTARFIVNGRYTDVDFTGTTCSVPIITNTDKVTVGVYAGDLHTTTPATIGCKRSILCGAAKSSPENDKDLYETLMAEIEALKVQVDKLDKQLNPMLDVWRISDTAQIYDCSIRAGFTFYANGAKFGGIYIGDGGDPHLVYLRNGEWAVYVAGMSGSADRAYLTIGFDPNQDISQEFLDWLEANATFIGNEPIPEVSDMIYFSVHGVSFSCPRGMTWNEFIGSEYDTTVDRDIDIPNSMFAIDNWGEGDVVQYDWSSVYYEHGGFVYATDEIIDGTAY